MNRKIATFRSFAKHNGEAILTDYSAPKPGKRHPHPLPEGIHGIDRMLERAKTSEETAIVVLCGLLSLRISEAREVRPSHFDLSVKGRPVLTVRGKGDKVRQIPVGARAWSILQPIYVSSLLADMKFVLLSDSGARRAWSRLGKLAELGRSTSSHDGRATVATHMAKRGTDIRTIQEILGHSSLETTQVYVGVSMNDMHKALDI